MSDTVFELSGVSKGYPGFRLDDISLSLERGYVLGLIGPNGAGKTTLIRLLLGLAQADSGEVRVLGKDPRRAGAAAKEAVGFVLDESPWPGRLSVADNAAWLSRCYRNWDGAAYRELTESWGLDPRKRLGELSKGQRMKFSLAVALSHKAELIVMDEPTGGLDPVSRSELLDALFALSAKGEASVVFSTHVTQDLERIADYIAFVNKGRLLFCEDRDEVLGRHALVRGPKEALDAGLESLLVGRRIYEGGFEGLTDQVEALRKAAPSLGLERASLEDIMVYSGREDYRGRTAS